VGGVIREGAGDGRGRGKSGRGRRRFGRGVATSCCSVFDGGQKGLSGEEGKEEGRKNARVVISQILDREMQNRRRLASRNFVEKRRSDTRVDGVLYVSQSASSVFPFFNKREGKGTKEEKDAPAK